MSSTSHRHRFPGQIIQYCVWLYFTFPLSYRDVEKMMLYRGIFVTYESIRCWCQKFGQAYANQIYRRRRHCQLKPDFAKSSTFLL